MGDPRELPTIPIINEITNTIQNFFLVNLKFILIISLVNI